MMVRQSAKSKFARRGRQTNLINDINVTPLVDVMLVLLIIFMITSPMLISGIQVDLPKTSAGPVAPEEQPITITIEANNKISVAENNYISREQLTHKLKIMTSNKLDTRIFIRGDARINYGKIMEILGEINAAGFTKVALITELKKDA